MIFSELAFAEKGPDDAEDEAAEEVDQHRSVGEHFACVVFNQLSEPISKQRA
jgi:hypothetical protein